MAWSGGNYTKGNNATGGWAGDASLGIGIEAGRHDTQDNDFATGINQCLNKDGSNAATGNLNLGGNKLTNVAVGTASTDGITLGQAQAGISTSGTALDITNTRFSADAVGPQFAIQKSRGAAVGTNTIVSSGDSLGAIYFRGANGTSYTNAAIISCEVDGTPGATNDMPGRLAFATTPDGAGIAQERMRITSSGNVGIGTTNPTSPLTVGDGTGQKIIVVNGANSGTGGGSAFTWQNGSNPIIAIGNYSAIYGGAYDASPTFYNGSGLAYRVGNMTAAVGTHFMKWHNSTGAWTYDTSSARYKDNIEDSSYGLAEVLAMRPVTFTYKAEPDRHDVGFIAEEMVNVVPEVVAKNTEGEPDAISYDRLTSVLCKAIQELNAKVEALEARIAALEA